MSLATPQIDVDGHLGDQWERRTGRARYEVRSAWFRADPVQAPDVDGDARLYRRDDARDLLLVERDGYVRTVLYADHDRLEGA